MRKIAVPEIHTSTITTIINVSNTVQNAGKVQLAGVGVLVANIDSVADTEFEDKHVCVDITVMKTVLDTTEFHDPLGRCGIPAMHVEVGIRREISVRGMPHEHLNNYE